MTQKFTNTTGIPLELAVWLAYDEYDHSESIKEISVTTLLKPIKQIILGMRTASESLTDISSQIESTIGTDIHRGLEIAWKNPSIPLAALGYPSSVIKKIRINPSPIEIAYTEDNHQTIIPVYLEQRTKKEIVGWTISGKFDIVIEGKVKDLKTTSTYTYIRKSNDKKNAMQGSIYRWLNQDIITEDMMSILYEFKDWSAIKASDPAYPKSKLLEYPLPLMSIPATEKFIIDKLNQITALVDEPEVSMPACTDEDLWVNPPTYAYYKNPNKTTGRSTKNFTSHNEALLRLTTDGSVGVLVERRSMAKACKWCPALGICDQAKSLVREGRLVISI